jgi:tetratricopeptide (TPR) repeat protein
LIVAPGSAQSPDSVRAAFRVGKYEQGIAMAQAGIARTPAAAALARELVRGLTAIGRYDGAIAAARRGMQASPNTSVLWTPLGDALALTGNRAAAESAYVHAVQGRAPDSLAAKLGLAVLAAERGEVRKAHAAFDGFIDVYNRGTRLRAADLTAVATAVRYLAVSNPQLAKDALRAYDQAIAADTLDLEPRVRLGELFLERYNGTDARETFEGVLKVNPREPRALLGLARTRRFEGSAEAVVLASKALSVNPNLVPGHVFLAQLYLESEDYDAAKSEVDQALAVNPQALEALAALAAMHYLSGDTTAFDATVRRTLDLNPADADLFATLADVSARGRRYADAAKFARRGVALDSTSWRSWTLLGINQLRAGQVDSGRATLARAFRGDPFDVWTKNTLDLLDQLVRYDETRSPRFRVYVARKESAVLSLYMNDLLEEAYDSLSRRYGYRPAAPLRVEVFPNHADFSVRTVGLVGLGALGVSFGPVIVTDSPSARDEGEFSWAAVLWHELSHTFHLGMTDHRVPRWFTEGLADYEERRARPGWGDGVTPGFLAAFNQGRLHPVSDLNAGFSRPAYPEQLFYSYYQASQVCEMIEQELGPKALLDMLAGYKAGKSTADLVRQVLGSELPAFDRHFNDYMRTRYGAALAAIGKPDTNASPHTREEITRRSANPADLTAQLLMGKALLDARQADSALPYLLRAKALFPEYGGADSPRWLLAQAYQMQHDTAKAIAELDTLTRKYSQLYPAYIQLADLLEARRDTTGAAEALNSSMYVWPLDLKTHRRLASLSERLHQWNRLVRERRAVVALEPVDHAEALYQLARAYLLQGDKRAARRTVLQALDLAPNFPAAQDLLVSLSNGGGL